LGLALAFALGLVLANAWPLPAPLPDPWQAEDTQLASVKIAAVRSDGSGVVLNLEVEVIPNRKGLVLVATDPLVGFDFQYAERVAVKVAAAYTGFALDDDGEGLKGVDIVFKISPPAGEGIGAVDGPSAGATAAVALIGALENKQVRGDVTLTGTIREDGRIGPVGGIMEKAEAARDEGIKLFLVPPGQSVVTLHRWEEVRPGYYILRPVVVNLGEYAQQEWGMEIREISTIGEAVRAMLIS